MRRSLWIVAFAAASSAAVGLGLLVQRPTRHGARAAAQAGPGAAAAVEQVRSDLASSYYRPVPPRILRLPTVGSMLAALRDPYTEYLDPAGYSRLREETAGSYSGVGLTVAPGARGLRITSVAMGPALGAGIRPGDTIVAVDGAPTGAASLEQVVARILGPRGTPVRLRILRGARLFEVRLVRGPVAQEVVRARVLLLGRRRFGYLRLAGFPASAAGSVRQATEELERARISGLVLDLRDNPGGLLDEAVAVASLYLVHGVVVTTKGAHQPRRVYAASGRPAEARLPLVVLVDRLSVSAAEVVAAALRDHRRAVIVGQRTFGKALVQAVEPLGNGAALRLTVARYLTPAGHDISGSGIRPDVPGVDNPRTPVDEALTAALRTLLGQTTRAARAAG